MQEWKNDAWVDSALEWDDLKVADAQLQEYSDKYPKNKFRLVQYVNYLRILKEKL